MKKFALAPHLPGRQKAGESQEDSAARKRRSSLHLPFEGASAQERREYFYRLAGTAGEQVREVFEEAMARVPERSLRFARKPIVGDDVRRLAGVAGHRSEMDTAWVNAVHPYQRKDFRNAAGAELREPDRALLIRYILGFPERDILPKLPDARSTYDKVAALWPRMQPYSKGQELNPKTFAILCGYNAANGYRWLSRDGKPGLLSFRVFYLLSNAIDQHGESGLRDWIDILNAEAYSRLGVPLEVVFEAGGWSVNVLERHVAMLAERGGGRRRRRRSRAQMVADAAAQSAARVQKGSASGAATPPASALKTGAKAVPAKKAVKKAPKR